MDGECGVVRGWTLMGDVVWFVVGGRWGISVFVDGIYGEWRIDVLVESRMEETSN